jgi:aspartyl protease family protein
MLHPLLQAQLGSADFAGAARTADELVESFPTDPNVWGWRADLREKAGDYAAVVQDWRQALRQFANPETVALSVYYSLARAEARAGRPCDAVLTIRDFVAFEPRQRRTPQVETIMRDWRERGDCPAPFGQGAAVTRYNPNAGAVVVPADINGIPARVIVDTGAKRTVLTQKFATRAGVEPDGRDGAVVVTGNGVTWLPGGRVRKIAVGNATAHDVPVFVMATAKADLGGEADALLGFSFLGNFNVHLGSGILALTPLD